MAAARTKPTPNIHASLQALAQRIHTAQAARVGDIVFHLRGAGGGDHCITRTHIGTTVAQKRAELDHSPLIEVWGDAEVIHAILSGKRNAVKQFIDGGIQIRGDLHYFTQLAGELGILGGLE